MRHYILATHLNFAEGIYESIKFIIGEQKNVHIINAFENENDIEVIVKKMLSKIPQEDEIIVTTDILGGSVNNEFMKYLNRPGFYLITGMNLPLLMQLFLSTEKNTKKMIVKILESKETCPILCNDLVQSKCAEEDF